MDKVYTFIQTVTATFMTIFIILVPTIKKITENPFSTTEAWFVGNLSGIVLVIVWLVTILSWLEKE